MQNPKVLNFIKNVLNNLPENWINLTTHRLDIYNESLAKSEFLSEFDKLFNTDKSDIKTLENLPTAYDYIRLGHPLSCVLEWTIGILNNIPNEQVITFDSKTIALMAILRTNLLKNKNTTIYYSEKLPFSFDAKTLKSVYNYNFQFIKIENLDEISNTEGSSVFISNHDDLSKLPLNSNVDFLVSSHSDYGSVLLVNGQTNSGYISDIQHVRRRETVAMTPKNALAVLEALANNSSLNYSETDIDAEKLSVQNEIKTITDTSVTPLVASSGLSIQYAIMMGLIDDAQQHHPNKPIKFVVPPNCYGGTNDQARRVAACLDNVEIVDLPVDGDNDMVNSTDKVLSHIAAEDAIPYIIAEIPTNPRVEVPVLEDLKAVLGKKRQTKSGKDAVGAVFILDQTFCPNVNFLGQGKTLSSVKAISYSSGSKFPSGGLCTAGYCAFNKNAEVLQTKIAYHLSVCDNEATKQQYQILAKQLPSMLERINGAYINTREFVDYIEKHLPEAKINFVSEELAEHGFTPSVFSLDLPTKGNTEAEKETYKRELNHRLINMMITKIPNESKYCVSYGQLKGCYWTIPATSTQGTTKEGDKDYIARVALSGNMDLEKHKDVFKAFVDSI